MGGFKYKHLYHKLFFRLPIVISLLICFRNKKKPPAAPLATLLLLLPGLDASSTGTKTLPGQPQTILPCHIYVSDTLSGTLFLLSFFLPSSYFDALGQKQNIRLPLFFFRNIFPVLCSSLLVVIKCAFLFLHPLFLFSFFA